MLCWGGGRLSKEGEVKLGWMVNTHEGVRGS